MRTQNLFRTLVAASLAVVSMSAFGQFAGVTTTGDPSAVKNAVGPGPADNTQTEVVDIVTVGSSMPYTLQPDTNILNMIATGGGIFLPSEYSWRVDTDPAVGVTLVNAITNHANREVNSEDSAVNLTQTVAGYYEDDSITIKWFTAGQFDIAVRERSRNTIGLDQCMGTSDTTLRVYVMPRPDVDWAEASTVADGMPDNTLPADLIVGGCGTASAAGDQTYNIIVNLTTYTADAKIAYTREKYNLSDMSTPASTATQTLLTSGNYNETGDDWYTAAPGVGNNGDITLEVLTVLDSDVPANFNGAFGKWVYTITAINDRISRKSNIASVAGDFPATTFTVYSLPTPITGTIKHVSNVTGW